MGRMFKNMKDLRSHVTDLEKGRIDQEYQDVNQGMPAGAYSSSSNYLQEKRSEEHTSELQSQR